MESVRGGGRRALWNRNAAAALLTAVHGLGRIRLAGPAAALAAVVLVLGAAPASAGKKVSAPVTPIVAAPLGVSLFNPVGAAQLDRMRAGGVAYVRVPLQWNFVESPDGKYDFSYYDTMVLEAARREIGVLPVLIGTPYFLPHRDGAYPDTPAGLARLGAFSRAAVARYGPGGSLWADHPDVAPLPVHTWQVWNEPNLKIYAPNGRPSVESYRQLLFHCYNAIKSGDPGAEVLLAAIAPAAPVSDRVYLRQLLGSPGVASHFDSVAIHPYARTPDQSQTKLERFVRDLRRTKTVGRGVWVSEIGWSSGGPTSAFQTRNPSTQAAAVREVIELFQEQDVVALRGITWFAWRDLLPTATAARAPEWAPYAGLFTFYGYPKPAWTAFTKVSGGNPGAGALPAERYP